MHHVLSVFALFLLVQNRPGSLESTPETETFNKRKNDVCSYGKESITCIVYTTQQEGIFFLK